MTRYSFEARVWVATFFIAVANDVLSGAVRYYTSSIGLAPAAYLPKVMMVAWVSYVLIKQARAIHGLIVLYLVAEMFISLTNGVQPASVFFWVWTLVPMFFALTAPAQSLALMSSRTMAAAFVALTVVCGIGILLSGITTLPWVGESVSVGGHSVMLARASYVGVTSRLSGFGRDSASVALMAGLLTTWVLLHTRSRLASVALLAGAGAAIYGTTNKTAPMALGIVVVAHVLFASTRGFRRACLAATAFTVVLPIISFFASAAFNLPGRGFLTLSSFQDRMANTWPGLLEALTRGGYVWLGLGPGSFGSAANYYESPFAFNVSWADNTFLYVVASLGLVGALVLILYTVRLVLRSQLDNRAVWAVLLYLLFTAASTDIFESIGCLLFLGLAFSFLRNGVLASRLNLSPNEHRHVSPLWLDTPSPRPFAGWLERAPTTQEFASLSAERGAPQRFVQ